MSSETTLSILPCYRHLWHSTEDINLLWGGRDSGKSYFIAEKLLTQCTQKGYFRCILVKKTHESIKDAQWQLLKDIAESSGMAHLFKFTRSPLEIICTHNGNKFISRGCDNPEKLKSIADPSSVWIEEANQLSQSDYLTISTTLRSTKTKIQEWLSFNPEAKGDYKDHWIYQDFLAWDSEQLNYTRVKEMEANGEKFELTYTSTHTTYKQNPYCTPQQQARHEHLQEVNAHRYRVFTLGLWGNEENDNPWAWALNRDKHYTPEVYEVSKNYNLDISFDFNHSPCVCIVSQFEQHKPRYNVIAYLKASSGEESAIKQLCDRIKTMFPHHARTKQLTITGDASGKQRDASRPSNINRYSDIARHLQISDSAVKIERGNTTHKASRDLCNDVLHQIPKGGYLFWGGQGCEMLLSEIESAFPDDKESLNKFKKEEGGHGVDAWRYLNGLWFAHRLVGSRFREYQKKIDSVVMRLKAKAPAEVTRA